MVCVMGYLYCIWYGVFGIVYLVIVYIVWYWVFVMGCFALGIWYMVFGMMRLVWGIRHEEVGMGYLYCSWYCVFGI